MITSEIYMRRCFELAMKGAGNVSPNPLVGAVIVKDNKIISEGYHAKYGEAHAEANAIKSTSFDLTGTTLYCNLEPCVHEDKQTPPCVPLIIKSGIKKVVLANVDPNPKVNNKGIQKLINNNIVVESGILEKEGKELNKFFFKQIKTGIPYVTVKIAQSSNNKIYKTSNEQFWLTGNEARKFVHYQRSIYDAVLVGANTVNVDNPQLTVREVEGRNPARIIIDGNLSSNTNANVYNSLSKTIIICSSSVAEEKKQKFLAKNIKLIEVEPIDESNHLEIGNVLKILGEKKILSIYVEGGGKIFNEFIYKFADEVQVITAPCLIESAEGSFSFSKEKFSLIKSDVLGKDKIELFRRKD